MKILYIEVEFKIDPSAMGEQDIKDAVQDLKNTLAGFGKVRRADLVISPLPEVKK